MFKSNCQAPWSATDIKDRGFFAKATLVNQPINFAQTRIEVVLIVTKLSPTEAELTGRQPHFLILHTRHGDRMEPDFPNQTHGAMLV